MSFDRWADTVSKAAESVRTQLIETDKRQAQLLTELAVLRAELEAMENHSRLTDENLRRIESWIINPRHSGEQERNR